MAAQILKRIQTLTLSLKSLTTRCYKPATFPKINLNQNTNLNGDSLQVRFLKYIGISNSKDFNTEKSKIKYSDFFPITDPRLLKQNISEVDVADIPTLLNYLYTYNTRSPPNNVVSCINLIEREICPKIDLMTSTEIFNILFAYMFVIPGFTNQLRFYNQAMIRLSTEIDSMSKEHLTQYCFYLGLSKTYNQDLKNVLKNILLVISDKYLKDFTTEELCIIANGAFKMSVKINTVDMLNHIRDIIIKGLRGETQMDIPILVTLFKSLRHSRYYSTELLTALSQYINTNVDELNITAISHILPYYADNYYLDENSIKKLVTQFLDCLKNKSMPKMHIFESNNVRDKDLSRFLWALSYLGYPIDVETCENLENIVLDKFNSGDYKYNIDELFNTALSFTILNYIPKRLLNILLLDNYFKQKPNISRSEERRHLLLSILSVEYKEIFEKNSELKAYWKTIKDEPIEPMTYRRQNLQNVLNAALKMDEHLNNVKMECAISFLNTPGISAISKIGNKIYIEVLDETVCLKNTNSLPHGIMKLKLRLLRQINNNCSILLIKSSDIEDQNEEHIKAHLLKEIAKIS